VATITSVASGNWSNPATWDSGIPVDNDTVIIAAGHTVVFDVDQSAFANGMAGVTITGIAAGTPGMLVFKYDVDGTYHLKIKTGTQLRGTAHTVFGRLLANSDGAWGNSGALPFGRKAIIDLVTTAYINALYLDIALYCTQPIYTSARVYNTLKTVSSINTATDVITMTAAHGWTANTRVMVRSSGTLPGGLAADTVYYVRSPSGADLKLSQFAGDPAVDITSAGTGTIELYDGHTNTGTATVNVLDDVTGDPCWTTMDGHDYVVLVDAAAPEIYDQQRVQLNAIAAGTLTLSANVDSAQYPGARVWLSSRNISIRCSTTTAGQNIVDYGVGALHGGVFQCEIRSTAGTGTTFYGNGVVYGRGHIISGVVSGCYYGVNGGTGHTISGVVSGCLYGVNGGTGHTISGVVSGCYYGVNGGTGHTISGVVSGCYYGVNGGTGHTISGVVSGCLYGVIYGTGHTISGVVSGCSDGISSGTGHTVSGAVSGCSNGIIYGTSYTVSGSVSGCYYGVYGGTGHTVSGSVSGCYDGVVYGRGHIISGVVSGCGNGVYYGTGHTVSGVVSGCSNGLNGGVVYLHGAVFSNNTRDLLPAGGYYLGWAVQLNSSTQVASYKHASIAVPSNRYTSVCVVDLGGTSGALGFWTLGGYCKSAAYSAPMHGTPPVTPPALIHEMLFEDNDRWNWVELPIRALAGKPVTVTFYGKLTGVSLWTARPTIGIYDPNEPWQDAAEALNVSAQMASNTNWQTLTATYTPVYDRELRLRVQGIGGNAGGTGTEYLYWFMVVSSGGAGGAPHILPRRASIGG